MGRKHLNSEADRERLWGPSRRMKSMSCAPGLGDDSVLEGNRPGSAPVTCGETKDEFLWSGVGTHRFSQKPLHVLPQGFVLVGSQ